MAENIKRVLRAPEAASYTGLSESTLAKRRLYGLPPAFLNLGGRAVGYAIEDLNSWLDNCRRQSTSQQDTLTIRARPLPKQDELHTSRDRQSVPNKNEAA